MDGKLKVTRLDIFFKDRQFVALHRSELFGRTDFMANIGGLLGFFLGFSVWSLIEIVYFSTIHIWWKMRRTKQVNARNIN